MHISIDTTEPLSDTDKQILAVLSGGAAPKSPATEKVAAPATAKKAAAAPAKAAKVEPEPEPEDDDVLGDDGPSLEDAKALARTMVSNGEAAKVKKALTAVGASKVSEVPEDKGGEFHAALSS